MFLKHFSQISWHPLSLGVDKDLEALTNTGPGLSSIPIIAVRVLQGLSILLLLTLEVMGVMWLYGMSRFVSDIDFMLNRSIGLFWKACWLVVNPIFLAAIFIYSQTQTTVLTYGGYVFGSIENGMCSPCPALLMT